MPRRLFTPIPPAASHQCSSLLFVSGREERYGGQKFFPRLHEMKLLLVASTGFFIDAYDLFVINLIVPILNILVFNKKSGTITQISLKGGTLKAAANLGCIVGQIGFGTLGDIYGRRRVWPAVSGAGLCAVIRHPLIYTAGSRCHHHWNRLDDCWSSLPWCHWYLHLDYHLACSDGYWNWRVSYLHFRKMREATLT